jgi:hypothetical protein
MNGTRRDKSTTRLYAQKLHPSNEEMPAAIGFVWGRMQSLGYGTTGQQLDPPFVPLFVPPFCRTGTRWDMTAKILSRKKRALRKGLQQNGTSGTKRDKVFVPGNLLSGTTLPLPYLGEGLSRRSVPSVCPKGRKEPHQCWECGAPRAASRGCQMTLPPRGRLC